MDCFDTLAMTGGNAGKASHEGAERQFSHTSVIARSKATKQSCHITLLCVMDCFATLAMTGGNAGEPHAKARSRNAGGDEAMTADA